MESFVQALLEAMRTAHQSNLMRFAALDVSASNREDRARQLQATRASPIPRSAAVCLSASATRSIWSSTEADVVKLIREVLEEKALQQLVTVGPGAPITDAAELMSRWNVGALLVMDAGRLVGLISERDCVYVVATGRSPLGVTVREIMSRHVRLVPSELTTEECMWLMTYLRLRHLPVVDGGEVLGVVSIGDLVKDVITEQAHLVDDREGYSRAGRTREYEPRAGCIGGACASPSSPRSCCCRAAPPPASSRRS